MASDHDILELTGDDEDAYPAPLDPSSSSALPSFAPGGPVPPAGGPVPVLPLPPCVSVVGKTDIGNAMLDQIARTNRASIIPAALIDASRGIPAQKTGVDFEKLRMAGQMILEAIGEDTTRPGIKDTPERYAKWWREFIEYNPGKTETTFAQDQTDQMVIVSGMRVWSLCEHHLLPFYADVSIAYVAQGQVLGLSKFARIAHLFAHRLQIQEGLVQQIADECERVTGSPDIAVLARGEHLCMTMRGIRTEGMMTSSVMRGLFRHDPNARQEFLSLSASRQK